MIKSNIFLHTCSIFFGLFLRRASNNTRISTRTILSSCFIDSFMACKVHSTTIESVLPSTCTCCLLIKFVMSWQLFATRSESSGRIKVQQLFINKTALCKKRLTFLRVILYYNLIIKIKLTMLSK